MADLKKSRRITGPERASVTEDLRAQYDAGASIRQLAQDTGRSYGFVHGVLVDGGATMRGRGGATRTKAKK